VQFGQRLALIEMEVSQYGHCLVVASAAGEGLCMRLIMRTIKKTVSATMIKLMTVLMKIP
jgi:hypothetical protein